jgi:hypothetical protein
VYPDEKSKKVKKNGENVALKKKRRWRFKFTLAKRKKQRPKASKKNIAKTDSLFSSHFLERTL